MNGDRFNPNLASIGWPEKAYNPHHSPFWLGSDWVKPPVSPSLFLVNYNSPSWINTCIEPHQEQIHHIFSCLFLPDWWFQHTPKNESYGIVILLLRLNITHLWRNLSPPPTGEKFAIHTVVSWCTPNFGWVKRQSTIAACDLSLPSSFFLEFTLFFMVTNMVVNHNIYIHLNPSISHIPSIFMAGKTPIWITLNSYILMISPMTRHPWRATRLTCGLAILHVAQGRAELVGTKGISLQVVPGGNGLAKMMGFTDSPINICHLFRFPKKWWPVNRLMLHACQTIRQNYGKSDNW